MEAGAHREANADPCCTWASSAQLERDFPGKDPNRLVLFYPGHRSTGNAQVLHAFASLLWREDPGWGSQGSFHR